MKVKVKLSQPFSGIAGRSEVVVSPDHGNLGALLSKLCSEHPRMKDQIFDKDGNVMDHLNIFVNQVPVTSDSEKDMPVHDGDRVTLLIAVGGG